MDSNPTPPPANAQGKLAAKLGLPPSRQQAFLQAVNGGKSGKTALVVTPSAPEDYQPPFPCEQTSYPWVPGKVFILGGNDSEISFKPGSHRDYLAGYYYPLDLSSVWETAGLSRLTSPQRVLDMCSAPGGKSVLLQTRRSPGLHIANEVHPKRLGILRNNLSRCGFDRIYTQRLRPDQWAEAAPLSFDLVLVDAPCSGQSLLAKGIENPGCFHPSVMKGNAKRQRSILHSSLKTLAPGGHLLYTTCTFSPEENEKTMAYILKRYDDMEATAVSPLESFQSPLVDFPCYRLLPDSGTGSGGFSCLLRKKGTGGILPDLDQDLLAWPIPSHASIGS